MMSSPSRQLWKFFPQSHDIITKNDILMDANITSISDQINKWKKMSQYGLERYLQHYYTNYMRRLRKGVPQEYRWAAWKAVIRLKKYELTQQESKNETTKLCEFQEDAQSVHESPRILQPSICDKADFSQSKLENTLMLEHRHDSQPHSSYMREQKLGSETASSDAIGEGVQRSESPHTHQSSLDTSCTRNKVGSSKKQQYRVLPPYVNMDWRDYSQLSRKRSAFSNLIAIDVPRTFPDIESFDQSAQKQLRRLLNAFANYKPQVGYCQGLNFVVGLLLLVSNFNELETFEVLLGMMELYCFEGLYYENFPLLRKYDEIFDSVMMNINPKLYKHFQDEGVSAAVYLHQWILTLFVQGLPLKTTVVVWDFIFAQGIPGILVICVTLLQILQRFIINLNFESTIKFLKSLKKSGKCDESRIGRLLAQQGFKTVIPSHLIEPLMHVNLKSLYEESCKCQLSADHFMISKELNNVQEEEDENPLFKCFDRDNHQTCTDPLDSQKSEQTQQGLFTSSNSQQDTCSEIIVSPAQSGLLASFLQAATPSWKIQYPSTQQHD